MSRTARVLPFVLFGLVLPGLGAQQQASPLTSSIPGTSSFAESDPSLQGRRTLPPHAQGPIAERLLDNGPGSAPDRVLFDEPGDGRIWALGSTYKASFGADGFVYIPYFGSAAPKNYPVQFALRSVRVGGRNLPFAADATATRTETRVTLDRGAVREVYDLTPRGIEQTFVVDGAAPGDVDVELTITTELAEDPNQDGLQFGNHLGEVDYGTAYLVHGVTKSEIPASVSGRTLRLHVPAAQRGAGPVVIDPFITTRTLTQTLKNSEIPDIAYDATNDRWAIAWVHVFSATDHDVVAELRTADGEPIAGSFKTIDIAGTSHTWPRIANLNSANRFLIVMERFVPTNPVGQQYTIWGRTLDAAAPFGMSTLVQISSSATADQRGADVGGDPGNGSRWMVVWGRGYDIVGKLVDAAGTPGANTITIEAGAAVCVSPQVSLSNGNGLTATPRWCVVYSLQVTQTDWDVYGAVLDPNGTVTKSHSPITTGTTNDLYTFVSSPSTDVGTAPNFLVSYERQGTSPEMVVKLVDANLGAVFPEVNLTRRFGFSGIFCRVESDGCRFAAMCQIGTSLRIGTLAVVNNDLVLHEQLQSGFGTSVTPFLASKRSGGGGRTDYGIAFTSPGTPSLAVLGLYEGRAPAGGFDRRYTSCGLNLDAAGRPYLGEVVNFTFSNPRTDLVVLVMGLPATATPLCANCSLGVNLTGPLFIFPAPLSLPLPCEPIFVGLKLAVQGFGVGSGPCPGPFRVSDTIDFTIQ